MITLKMDIFDGSILKTTCNSLTIEVKYILNQFQRLATADLIEHFGIQTAHVLSS